MVRKKTTNKTTKGTKKPIKNKIKSAKPDKYFILADGRPIRNILELAYAFDDMDDWVYAHHTQNGNNFAEWVKNVFKDNELSAQLTGARSKQESQIQILKHIVRGMIK